MHIIIISTIVIIISKGIFENMQFFHTQKKFKCFPPPDFFFPMEICDGSIKYIEQVKCIS